jgi:putative Mg2+ transporter-C (MgtC) family protein
MTWQAEGLLVVRIVAAACFGGVLGWQREHMGIEAGVRTYAGVALGACIFGLISFQTPGDTRIASNVPTGIGFLCAGVILRQQGHITGLTTAATLWAAAGIGLAVAQGMLIFAGLVTIVLFALLAIPLKKWEHRSVQSQVSPPPQD